MIEFLLGLVCGWFAHAFRPRNVLVEIDEESDCYVRKNEYDDNYQDPKTKEKDTCTRT